jgi:ribose transport system substrate-binding protein
MHLTPPFCRFVAQVRAPLAACLRAPACFEALLGTFSRQTSLFLYLFLSLLVPFMAGCRAGAPQVAVIPRTTGTLLWEPMHQGAAAVAASHGVHLYWNAPSDEGDVQKQIRLLAAHIGHSRAGILGRLHSLYGREDAGIVFAPDETLVSRSLILEAMRRQIPVVIVDDELGPEPGPYLSYVRSDEAAGAHMAAACIAGLLHGHGQVAIMGISTNSEGGVTREGDVEQALHEAAPGVEIVLRRFGDQVVAHQQQIAQRITASNPHVDAVIALTAAATRGAYYARLTGNLPASVRIVGFDQDLLTPVREGDIDAVIVQDTPRIGAIAVQNVIRQMHSERVSGLTLVPPLLLTRQTIDTPQMKALWAFSNYDWSHQ